jgi:hypothetical protein
MTSQLTFHIQLLMHSLHIETAMKMFKILKVAIFVQGVLAHFFSLCYPDLIDF